MVIALLRAPIPNMELDEFEGTLKWSGQSRLGPKVLEFHAPRAPGRMKVDRDMLVSSSGAV